MSKIYTGHAKACTGHANTSCFRSKNINIWTKDRSVQTTVSFTKFSFEEKEVLGLLSPLKILFFSLANIDNI